MKKVVLEEREVKGTVIIEEHKELKAPWENRENWWDLEVYLVNKGER